MNNRLVFELGKLLDNNENYRDEDIHCHKIQVYDNEGETFDRYAIYLEWSSELDMWTELINCSVNPTHPLGVWTTSDSLQFDYDVDSENEHLGKKISFYDLPEETRKAILNYIIRCEIEMNKISKVD